MFIAPEQALGEVFGPASDWYGVGVMLYEALVGRPPFSGSDIEIICSKVEVDPPSPAECVEGVPIDLDMLCRALLDRNPELRPTGPEILRRFDATRGMRPMRSLLPLARVGSLVGRAWQLRSLRDAFDRAKSGQSVTVTVAGASGMGKSAVAEHFLDTLLDAGEATVLRGRAYERETIPYKAFDGVIDALSRYLLHLDDEADPVALPADIAALARIFPVLRRIPRVEAAPDDDVRDPHTLRRRAFQALRQLLGSLADKRPLAVYVDDVQWGDADSATLLLELVRAPDAPPVFFMLTYRDNDAMDSAFLRALRSRWSGETAMIDLMVGPLTADEASNLALSLMGTSDPTSLHIANAIARESGGCPFLVEELARTNQALLAWGTEVHSTVILEKVVMDRLKRLSPATRRLLEVVAVAGQPILTSVVAEAFGTGEGVDEAIAAARVCRFLRAGMRDGKDVVEMSHDRFRETIVAGLDPETLRAHHASLGGALERDPGADAEALAVHLLGAGNRPAAARFAERAATEADAKLAFDQAARLLQWVLEILPPSGADAVRVQVRLGEVLERAGRGAEAARAYLKAAELAPVERKVEIQGAAATQLLSCGRVDEGTIVLYRVLHAVGLKVPGSPASALFWLMVYRVWGAILGARHRQRDAAAVSPEDRVRIDALYAVSVGFAIVNVVLGACMQARHTIMALRRGDRALALRALAYETSHLAGEGGRVGRRELGLQRLGKHIVGAIQSDAVRRHGAAGPDAAELEAPYYYHVNCAVALYLRGRWKAARVANDAVRAIMVSRQAQGRANAALFSAYALFELGEIRELAARVDGILSDADQRGDLYTSINLRTTMVPMLALAADNPTTARRTSSDAIVQWSQRAYMVQHMQTMVYQAWIELYEGDYAAAFERTDREWTALRRSFLLNVQFIRGFTFSARGRSAAAAAEQAAPGRRGALLKEARRMARKLERERMPWTSAHAAIVRATLANAQGDHAPRLAALREAIRLGDAADMSLLAAAARYRLGHLLNGSEGAELLREARQAFADRDVRDVSRYARVWLPGRWVGPVVLTRSNN